MKRPPLITDAQWENVLRGGTKGERVLLLMAWLADSQKVREVGVNRGFWVERFLAATGLGPGFPWCAASLAFCCDALNVDRPKKGAAAVRNWLSWARDTGRLIPVSKARRGDLVLWINPDQTGHIGIVQSLEVENLRLKYINSIEGNTSSGVRGSQRDGDGLYRRQRYAVAWEYAIRL